MDGVMWILANKKTDRKEDLFFTMKFVRHKQSKYHPEGTPMAGMLIRSADVLDPVWMLQLLWKWDMGIDIIPEDKTSYTAQYHAAFLKFVEN